VANKKKNFYEILEVLPSASYAEIKDAFQRLTQQLQSEKTELNREDIDFRLNVIKFAFHTLSVPLSRDAYDAQIASEVPEKGASSNTSIVVQQNTDELSLKAEALLLRADAAALRADALLLRADATTLRASSTSLRTTSSLNYDEGGVRSLWAIFSSAISNVSSSFKRILTVLGGVIAFVMVLQVLFLVFANRQSVPTSSGLSKTEEKLYLQNYYQENGVRVGSKIEADLLDAEKKRIQNEERTVEAERRKKEDAARKEQQFVEESRRMGDRVSENLRREEEREREKNERKQQYQDEINRRAEQAENDRIERELARHRRNLNIN